eukprot:3173144-Amphidinium_carterae.1
MLVLSLAVVFVSTVRNIAWKTGFGTFGRVTESCAICLRLGAKPSIDDTQGRCSPLRSPSQLNVWMIDR